jgi:hypothetical protein
MPALQLDVVHVGSAQVLHVAIIERRYLQVPAKGASIHIEIIWQKMKILASPISYSNVFSVA